MTEDEMVGWHHWLNGHAAAAAKLLQLCPILFDPIDSSLQGSSIPGILQARTLEWVAISFSSAWKWKVKVKSFSHVWLFKTPWTAAYQAPPSIGIFKARLLEWVTIVFSQWTWVWVNLGSWWWTGKPGVLQSMGSQRVRHDWATELNSA